MEHVEDALRGLVGTAIVLAVLAVLVLSLLEGSTAAVVAAAHRPIVVVFVALMAIALLREGWSALAAHRGS